MAWKRKNYEDLCQLCLEDLEKIKEENQRKIDQILEEYGPIGVLDFSNSGSVKRIALRELGAREAYQKEIELVLYGPEKLSSYS